MDFEKILKTQQIEQQRREYGVLKLQKFLGRVSSETDFDNPKIFFEKLRTISAEELLSVLERINGVLTEIQMKDRDSFTSESGVRNEFMLSSTNELVPPPIAIRMRLLEETLVSLQALLSNELPERFQGSEEIAQYEEVEEVVARTLFNAIIYLHPFSDGNGRTARLTYATLSPKIADKSPEVLAKILIERPNSLAEYHESLNQSVLESMLGAREIKWVATDSEPQLPMFDTGNPTRGLDTDHLMFISAYSVMSESERKQYVVRESGGLVIEQASLPPALLEKVREEVGVVREDFVSHILKMSVYPEEWPDWLREPFLNAFK